MKIKVTWWPIAKIRDYLADGWNLQFDDRDMFLVKTPTITLNELEEMLQVLLCVKDRRIQ